MEKLTQALDAGKQRGYDEIRVIDSTRYLFQYAIRREANLFATYFLKIDESKYAVFEDYAEENMKTFTTVENALDHLTKQGADISKLRGVKGVLPF